MLYFLPLLLHKKVRLCLCETELLPLAPAGGRTTAPHQLSAMRPYQDHPCAGFVEGFPMHRWQYSRTDPIFYYTFSLYINFKTKSF